MLNKTTINKTIVIIFTCHRVFHNLLLEPCASSSILDLVVLFRPPIQLIDEPKFKVKVVLDSKSMLDKLYYDVDCLSHMLSDSNFRTYGECC